MPRSDLAHSRAHHLEVRRLPRPDLVAQRTLADEHGVYLEKAEKREKLDYIQLFNSDLDAGLIHLRRGSELSREMTSLHSGRRCIALQCDVTDTTAMREAVIPNGVDTTRFFPVPTPPPTRRAESGR